MSLALYWGTTPEERSLPFPCDRLIEANLAVSSFYRGITIKSLPEIIFRWLCQMRVAPYSYDWIDNKGRKSPRVLIEGIDNLEPGQSVMGSFELVDYEYGKHLTIRVKPGNANDLQWLQIVDGAATYMIVPAGGDECRLLVKGVFQYKPGLLGRLMSSFLAWGDLVMMRKQLLNFKCLAEKTARENVKR